MGARFPFHYPLPLPVSNDLLLVFAEVLHSVPCDVEPQHLPVPQQHGAAEDACVGDPLRQVILCASDERIHELVVHLRVVRESNFNHYTPGTQILLLQLGRHFYGYI